MDETRTTLPHRTNGNLIVRLVSALAQGRDMDQVRSLFPSSRKFKGTVSAAKELGFIEGETESLFPIGEKLALGDPSQKKKVILDSIIEYEPYELLLEAIGAQGTSEKGERKHTSIEWVEKWWNTNGYGSSQTNRTEGSTAFAEIVEFLDIGEYKQGRRGHPSRIEWADNAMRRVKEARNRKSTNGLNKARQEDGHDLASTDRDEDQSAKEEQEEVTLQSENNNLTLNFENGQVAKLSLPVKLTAQEKERMVSIVKLMVATGNADENPNESQEPQMEMDL